MAIQFRDYALLVGNEKQAFTENNSQSIYDDANTTIISGLQINVDVQYTSDKSKSSSDDTCISLYNLSDELIKTFHAQGCQIMLRAGYFDNMNRDASGNLIPKYDELPVIYIGTVQHVSSMRIGNDEVTAVICSSDKLERAITNISDTFPAGSKLKDILNTLIKKLNFSTGKIDLGDAENRIYEGGISVYGRVQDELNSICEENGLKWFTHNKTVSVMPLRPNQSHNNNAWDIGPDIILETVKDEYHRSQTRDRGTSRRKSKAPKAGEVVSISDALKTKIKQGVTVKVILDGRIRTGDLVKLSDTDDYNGLYRVDSMRHHLDYRGGNWSTELSIVAV